LSAKTCCCTSQAEKSASGNSPFLTAVFWRIPSLLLGYKDLELQNINPTAITQDPFQIPVCKLSYVQAKKAGNTEEYFRNLRVNKDCAADIVQAISRYLKDGRNITSATSISLIEKYGKERVEWVLAAAINSDMTNNLSNHKEWASQKKLPNEPHGIYISIHADHMNAFIDGFKDEVQFRDAEVVWDKGQTQTLSFADKMAVATKKSNEHNQNKPSTPTRKSNRSSGMEL